METQIAFSLDTKTKQTFSKNLKKQWLTTKWFFLMCIHAFNEKKIFPTITTEQEKMVDVNVSASEFLDTLQKELTNRSQKMNRL